MMKDDDFVDLFDSWLVKICWGLTMVSDFVVVNVLAILSILYEKHGEDSMKRSLYNQILSQVGYPVIIQNLIATPIWSWRIYFSPINPIIGMSM